MASRSQRSSSAARLIVIALGVLLVGALIGWSARGDSSPSLSPSPSARGSQTTLVVSSSPNTTSTDCPVVSANEDVTLDELPPEAADTMEAIAAGPPYPFKKDGTVFQNRERLLPQHSKGYYHEFTVVTPGSSDRGARRIIAGECNERWYTDDHYTTFRLIVGSP